MPASLKDTLALLSRASKNGWITVEEAARALSIPSKSASKRLGNLSRSGWLRRARRGLFLVLPLEARGDAHVFPDDPWVLAQELYVPCYIGGWTAAEHWSLTEQLFRSTFVVSAASVRRAQEQVLGLDFRIAKVSKDRLAGANMVWRGPVRVAVSGPERTLVDGLASPDWVGGVRHLAEMLAAYRESRAWSSDKLLQEMERFGRGSAYKRLGFLVERLWPKEKKLLAAARAGRSSGVIKLDPSVASRGDLDKGWGLWVNAAVPELTSRT